MVSLKKKEITKNEKFNMRINSKKLKFISKVAKRIGETLTEFVTDASYNRAISLIEVLRKEGKN